MELNAKILTDIPYKRVSQERDLKLDIYLPEGASKAKFPVVVFLHGGGWLAGNKESIGNSYKVKQLQALIEEGYAVVSVEYRLVNVTDIHFPTPIEDCKDAIRWIRKNAENYSLDSHNIGVWGTSAGGHLGLLTAYSSDDKFEGDPELKKYSARLNYVMDNFGPTELNLLLKPEISWFSRFLYKFSSGEKYDEWASLFAALTGLTFKSAKEQLREACNLYSPVEYIGNHCVPTLVHHGDADTLVPIEQSELLVQRLSEKNIEHEFYIFKGATHSFRDLKEDDIQKMVAQTMTFVKKHTI